MIRIIGFKYIVFITISVFVIFLIGCNKPGKAYASIQQIEQVRGGELNVKCFVKFPFLDKGKYGVCWSDESVIPIKGNYSNELNLNNYAEQIRDSRTDTVSIAIKGLPSKSNVRLRSYITYQGGSTVYTDGYEVFNTGLFEFSQCDIAEDEVNINNIKEQVISKSYTYNSYIDLSAETNNYTINMKFNRIPKSETYFSLTNDYYANPYDEDEVALSIKNKYTGCTYSNKTYSNIYIYGVNVKDEVIYIKFCDLVLSSGASCPYTASFTGLIKFEI